jgi:DDE superfamily endonuclease
VALHVIHRACELPTTVGRSLSQWDCAELARQLVVEGIVDRISPQSIQRILARCRLKPWRSHLWLHPRTPRDAAFRTTVQEIATLYTRPLVPTEVVLCLDELTSIQPRHRLAPTRPAQPGRPVHLEHEYVRDGALQLFAAFDTRTGEVYAGQFRRKRQAECIRFLDHLDRLMPAAVMTIHLICDNGSVHHGHAVRAWLADHPRFRMHFTPVHCSWMNQVEQWFSILRRKRLRNANFADLADLAAQIAQFIDQWNDAAHPFRWTAASFDTVLATVDAVLPPPSTLAQAA